jgi:hypothetical protein
VRRPATHEHQKWRCKIEIVSIVKRKKLLVSKETYLRRKKWRCEIEIVSRLMF